MPKGMDIVNKEFDTMKATDHRDHAINSPHAEEHKPHVSGENHTTPHKPKKRDFGNLGMKPSGAS